MLLLAFLAIAIVYYLIQKNKIRKAEKRDVFKEKQEKNCNSFLKKQEKKMQKKLKKINDEYYERI